MVIACSRLSSLIPTPYFLRSIPAQFPLVKTTQHELTSSIKPVFDFNPLQFTNHHVSENEKKQGSPKGMHCIVRGP